MKRHDSSPILANQWREERLWRTIAFRWLVFAVLVLAQSIIARSSAFGAEGDLIWESRLGDTGINSALAMTVKGDNLFVSGSFGGGFSHRVLVHDLSTGAITCELEGVVQDNALVTAGYDVVGAGSVFNGSGNFDFTVTAYSLAEICGIGSEPWLHQIDAAGGDDQANALATDGKSVFAAGILTNAAGNFDATVRAYDAKSGNLLWKDEVDKVGGPDWFGDVTTGGDKVFTTGFYSACFGSCPDLGPLIRAYSAASGDLLWKVDDDPSFPIGQTLATDGDKLYVGGFGGEGRSVRAYSTKSGILQWKNENTDIFSAFKIAVSSGKVFVVGSSQNSFAVKAYDAGTGKLLWEDNYNNGGISAAAVNIAIASDRVFAVGSVFDTEGKSHFLVRAYAAKTGALIWQDMLPEGGTFGQATAVIALKQGIFVGGLTTDTFGVTHYIVRAYESQFGIPRPSQRSRSDLTVLSANFSAFNVIPGPGYPGPIIYWEFFPYAVIANVGIEPATRFEVSFELESKSGGVSGGSMPNVPVDILNRGESRVVVPPRDSTGHSILVSPGKYILRVIVDSGRQVAEQKESNNVIQIPVDLPDR